MDRNGRGVNGGWEALILAQKTVSRRNAKLARRFVAFDVPYRFYFGTENETCGFTGQNRVFAF
jgi:hypothetical protein